MSVRLPGASDLEAFWELLRQGRTAVRELSRFELRDLPPSLVNDVGTFQVVLTLVVVSAELVIFA